MPPQKTLRYSWRPQIFFLIVASSLVYLTGIHRASYYRDDWYYAYDGYVAGPSIYHQMFSSDRPARGFFFETYYNIFEAQAFPYHLGAYFWRLLGSVAVLWLFRILWPKDRSASFVAALLSVIYPGYLWWVSGIEYQPMVASFAIHIFSIILTLKVLQTRQRLLQAVFTAGSILTGWIALLLVDYAVGMEVFRILCIFIILSKSQPAAGRVHHLHLTIRAAIFPLIIPLTFVFWKIFLFKGDREATDIAFQLNVLRNAPLQTSLLWAERLWQSFWNVTVLAWGVPLSTSFPSLRSFEKLSSVLIGLAVVVIILYAMFVLRDNDSGVDPKKTLSQIRWQCEAIWLGAVGTLFGILPVIMANRYVTFKAYSHYALPVSLAAAILATGLIYSFKSRFIRLTLLSLLVGISVLTHRATFVNAIHEEETIRAFWWQVYWRVPAFQEGTTLAVIYPSIQYGEDSDVVWGPANFMYFPEQNPGAERVRYRLPAIPMTKEGITNVIEGTLQKSANYRSHKIFLNYSRVVVLSQPSPTSCVHVIDERWDETSIHDSTQNAAMFPHSKIENVLTDHNIPVPLEFVFGAEPPHTWCYYYEKATMARQNGDWETVAMLGEQADKLGLGPNDLVEFMPFLEAYAYLENRQKIERIATRLNSESSSMSQACNVNLQMKKNGYPVSPEINRLLHDRFCQSSQ